jgi:hypothetical protein
MSRTVFVGSIPEAAQKKPAWNFIDRTGHRFGKLVALRSVKRPERPKAVFWVCRCDCGKETIVFVGHLTHGHTTSCGCHHLKRTSESHYKHGHAGATSRKRKASPEYESWCKMRERCYNPKTVGFEYYGGRGIKVCDRWRESFKNFLDDTGPRPPGMSIERKDTNGNYEPGNCKWATRYEQSNNRRSNVQVEIGGVTKNLSQWCVFLGVRTKSVRSRVSKGWYPIEALLTPIGKTGRRKGSKNGSRAYQRKVHA